MSRIETGLGWELRLGRWQDVGADVVCDALITDPPYSERTEAGVRSGAGKRGENARDAIGMGYDFLHDCDYGQIADLVAGCRGWAVVCGDHITWAEHDRRASEAGRYTFPPVVIAKQGAVPRMVADGPASQCEYMAVSRPRKKAFVGAWPGMPGWYKMQTVRHGHDHYGVRGAKSPDLMRAIIRDYSRPGDLVYDPYAGGATTLLAAVIEGRRAIGCECDPKTFDLAVRRLRAGYTPQLFAS